MDLRGYEYSKTNWKGRANSFGFSILILAVIVGAIWLAFWFEGGRSQAQDDCVNAKLDEAHENLGGRVYTDDDLREGFEKECAYGP